MFFSTAKSTIFKRESWDGTTQACGVGRSGDCLPDLTWHTVRRAARRRHVHTERTAAHHHEAVAGALPPPSLRAACCSPSGGGRTHPAQQLACLPALSLSRAVTAAPSRAQFAGISSTRQSATHAQAKRVVYVRGTFDLFHGGHARMLQAARVRPLPPRRNAASEPSRNVPNTFTKT